MQTYAETKGAPVTDWWKELENPPRFDSDRYYKLRALAREWVTCACGNLCAVIPRGKVYGWHDAPLDVDLRRLGLRFHDYVVSGNWPASRKTLAAIEARSAELLAEIQGKEGK